MWSILIIAAVLTPYMITAAASGNVRNTRSRVRMDQSSLSIPEAQENVWSMPADGINNIDAQLDSSPDHLSRHRRDWTGWSSNDEWSGWNSWDNLNSDVKMQSGFNASTFVIPVIVFMLFVGLIIFIILARKRGWACFRRPVYGSVSQNVVMMPPPPPQAYPAGPYYGPPQGPTYAPAQGYPPQQGYPTQTACQPPAGSYPQQQYPVVGPNVHPPPPVQNAPPPGQYQNINQPAAYAPYPTGAPAPGQPAPDQPPPSYEMCVPTAQAPEQSPGGATPMQQPSYNPEFGSAGGGTGTSEASTEKGPM